MYFASELRYLGKGTVEKRNMDGTLIVHIAGMGRGKVTTDQAFTTKRAALDFARVPQAAGWSDVARLSNVEWGVRS